MEAYKVKPKHHRKWWPSRKWWSRRLKNGGYYGDKSATFASWVGMGVGGAAGCIKMRSWRGCVVGASVGQTLGQATGGGSGFLYGFIFGRRKY